MPIVAEQQRLGQNGPDDYPRAVSVGPIGRLGRYTATHFRVVLVGWIVTAVVLGSSPRRSRPRCPGPAGRRPGRSPRRLGT